MHPRRLIRLGELIMQTISSAVPHLKDPELGFITITGAELSPDVSTVKVFYSVLGSEIDKKKTAAALDRAKSHLRSEVGKLENIRRVPHLIFIFDESVERADRVSRILNTINEEKRHDE